MEEDIDAYKFEYQFMDYPGGSDIDSNFVKNIRHSNPDGTTSKAYENLQNGQPCPVHG